MVLVLALSLNVEIHAGGIAEAFEKVEKHFRRHVADAFAPEFRFPDEPRSSAEIERHGAVAVVHRQHKAVAFNAAFVAQRLMERFSESECRVLDGVVLVDVEVAFHMNFQVDARMAADLLQHVVEKAQSGGNVRTAVSVEVKCDADVGFGGGAYHGGFPASGTQKFRYAVPTVGDEHAGVTQSGIVYPLLSSGIRLEQDALCSEIPRQQHVGDAVADDERVLQVVVAGHVFAQKGSSRLAGRLVFVFKRAVDDDVVERDSFVFECPEHLFMSRKKGFHRERRRAQSVLVRDNDALEIEVVGDEIQVAEHARHEFQFFERVELIVDGRFDYECAVAVNEQHAFFLSVIFHIGRVFG